MPDQESLNDRKFCNGCGGLNPAEATYCTRCGASLPIDTVATPATAVVGQTPKGAEKFGALPGSDHDEGLDLAPPAGRRRFRIVVALLTIALLVGTITPLLLSKYRPSTAQQYLDDLDAAKLRTSFKSDDDAVQHAKDLCDFIDGGGAVQGSAADKIAVDHYCHSKLASFRLLEPRTIQGELRLVDPDRLPSNGGVQSCSGSGPNADLHGGATLAVRSPKGGILGTTQLDEGDLQAGTCVFQFQVDLTPGQTAYVFAVGRRKGLSLSWRDAVNGPQLTYP